ncbi:MAG: hypothetical protein KC776_02425 [Myxococcales bacterium]|nr:hypothetical protein [Myxococcales bacterium]
MASHREIAYGLFRACVGVNILIHGLVRMPQLEQFAANVGQRLAQSPLPNQAVHVFALVLPALEAMVGALVTLGLFTKHALVVGTLLMLCLTVGMASAQNWSVVGVQLVYEIAYFLLLFHLPENRLSVDALRSRP